MAAPLILTTRLTPTSSTSVGKPVDTGPHSQNVKIRR